MFDRKEIRHLGALSNRNFSGSGQNCSRNCRGSGDFSALSDTQTGCIITDMVEEAVQVILASQHKKRTCQNPISKVTGPCPRQFHAVCISCVNNGNGLIGAVCSGAPFLLGNPKEIAISFSVSLQRSLPYGIGHIPLLRSKGAWICLVARREDELPGFSPVSREPAKRVTDLSLSAQYELRLQVVYIDEYVGCTS